jgi:replicative DNA helicase
MQARNNTNSREQEVSQISRGLKALAMDLQIPVLACAQLNRTIEGRAGETSRPTLSDLRDSGQIEQDADVVGMLWWGWEHVPEIDNGDGELLIRKNRNGALGTCYVKWHPEWVKFYERQRPVG